MEIILSTAEDYIINYLGNCGEDDGDWDTGYDNYEQVDPDEFTELIKEHAL